jgi:hypothetical protein
MNSIFTLYCRNGKKIKALFKMFELSFLLLMKYRNEKLYIFI